MAECAGGRRLRVDMHLHTCVSYDCLSRYEAILEVARERGIDRLVVTDHDAVEGARRMQALDPVRVIVGEEVKTAEGPDLIGIFLTEAIPRRTPAREACERIRAQGGVVYVPHPFDLRRSGGARLLDELADLVDVVEAHNARTWSRALNEQGEAWARAHGKLLGAGSDAHSPGEVGRGYVEVPPFEPNRASFLAALAAGEVVGRTYSSPAVSLRSTWAKVRKRLPGAIDA
jgi:predicted metal-dependent phosphoesterase TrpH